MRGCVSRFLADVFLPPDVLRVIGIATTKKMDGRDKAVMKDINRQRAKQARRQLTVATKQS